MLALLSVLVISCVDKEPLVYEPGNVTAFFNLSGEISENDIPFGSGRVETEEYTIYGVQINSVSDGGEQSYAYGLFDDLNNFSLTLIEGNQYRGQVTAFQKGTAYGLATQETSEGIYIDMPFSRFLENQFIYDINSNISINSSFVDYFTDADSSKISVYSNPEIVRYLSQQIDFIGEDSISVDVEMLRANFGVQLFADSLTTGSLTLELSEAAPISIDQPNNESEMRILQMSNLYVIDDDSLFAQNQANATIYHKFVQDGDTISNPLFNGNIVFKRNFIKQIFVNVGGSESGKTTDGFNISFEEVEFQYDSLYIGG